ncbi:ATP-binding protein [Streptomyces sp. H27-H1]|uniref:ATP-binding protein n=1 Tax=Streptomyces sp. H27-H1 TaxID=2996461 RepID=UPI002271F653|nr:ATP-binding protein [Streptomyces sp. H27-H1]MCY0927978.1 ATP-binding protein [Streptomyces sp. H27-H1]
MLKVAVTDASTEVPGARAPDTVGGTGGFGWHLINSLADQVQIRIDQPGGKTITAVLAPH